MQESLQTRVPDWGLGHRAPSMPEPRLRQQKLLWQLIYMESKLFGGRRVAGMDLGRVLGLSLHQPGN